MKPAAVTDGKILHHDIPDSGFRGAALAIT